MPQPNLSIIIPAYKEADRIVASLHTLEQFIKSRHYGLIEVLVMTQTEDDTGAAAQHEAKHFHEVRIISLGKRAGKGGAVRAGMLEAKGRYRLFMDADLATPLVHLDDVYAGMQRGDKVIIAVRDLLKIHSDLKRAFMSKFGNLVAQAVLLPGIKDTQCGFKAFEAHAAEEIFSRQTMTSWSFDMEVLKIARLRKYKIATFDASDWKDPKTDAAGLVGDSPLKAAIQTFVDIFRIRLNVWTGKYRHVTVKYEKSS